jgi:hypothetical protein
MRNVCSDQHDLILGRFDDSRMRRPPFSFQTIVKNKAYRNFLQPRPAGLHNTRRIVRLQCI